MYILPPAIHIIVEKVIPRSLVAENRTLFSTERLLSMIIMMWIMCQLCANSCSDFLGVFGATWLHSFKKPLALVQPTSMQLTHFLFCLCCFLVRSLFLFLFFFQFRTFSDNCFASCMTNLKHTPTTCYKLLLMLFPFRWSQQVRPTATSPFGHMQTSEKILPPDQLFHRGL